LWLIVQTTPHRFLEGCPVGPRFVRFAALFYGSLTVAAALWSGLRGLDLLLFGNSVVLDVVLGVSTAVATVSLGLLAFRLLPVLREIADELAPRLVDGASYGGLALVAVFSGVGEETLFRGVIQQEFGLVIASLVFGLVHAGPDRRYLVWTAWAVLAGFLFGALYEVTGGLLAPILAHSGHNAATLLLWKRSRKGSSQ
jgi:membrane protease YdiL (CAAX protease family)